MALKSFRLMVTSVASSAGAGAGAGATRLTGWWGPGHAWDGIGEDPRSLHGQAAGAGPGRLAKGCVPDASLPRPATRTQGVCRQRPALNHPPFTQAPAELTYDTNVSLGSTCTEVYRLLSTWPARRANGRGNQESGGGCSRLDEPSPSGGSSRRLPCRSACCEACRVSPPAQPPFYTAAASYAAAPHPSAGR